MLFFSQFKQPHSATTPCWARFNTDLNHPLDLRLSQSTNTHTHPFNGPLSGTTQVSQYQKGKTNLGFTEARDSEWQWHQLGHNASLHLAPDRQPHQHPTTLMFSYRPDALPAAQPTMPKHWRQFQSTNLTKNWMDSKPLCQHPSDNSLLWHQYPTVLLDLCTSQNLISFK